jgi:hypothetical protein
MNDGETPAMSERKDSGKQKSSGMRIALIAFGVIVLSMVFCTSISVSGGIWFLNRSVDRSTNEESTVQRPTWAADSAELTVAVSPVMAPVLTGLADEFNRQARQTLDGKSMTVAVVAYEPEKMVSAALSEPEFQAMSPDSTLWLQQLEQSWATQSQADTEPGSTDDDDALEADETVIPIGQSRGGEQVS